MRTRVLLVAMPKMLSDIVTEILTTQPDLDVVGERAGFDTQVCASIDQVRAAAVIVGTTRLEAPEVFCRLIRERLDTRLLAILDDGRDAYLYLPLGELSPARLINAVRGNR
jgi:hypothetical protein